jgi:DNA-binding winged helix-turn-helix (wHTH) protein/tetratricopeptide (TPR) repeat protein
MRQFAGSPRCEAYLFDCFEASLTRGALLREGERLSVQDLPFRMLVALLERSGEIVTKEQLTEQLWGRQIAGDTDRGLYIMAGKLRHALGDDANNPRYIKTISGQGYRFIASVKPRFSPSEAPPLPPPLTALPESGMSRSGSELARTEARPSAIGMSLRVKAALSLALCVAIAASTYRYEHRALMTGEDKVVIAAFSNGTGHPDLDETLSSAFQSQIQESPYLNLAPEQKYLAAVKSPNAASLQDELRACVTVDGQVLLKGSIAVHAQGYRISVTAWRCAGGGLLTTQEADSASQATILSALDLATERMRRRLGEPEESLKKFNVPAVQATTASLAALKAFNAGEEKRFVGNPDEAIASYKLAVDLDPEFALAYARLGTIYHNLDQATLSSQFYKKAFELRSSRASDRERLYIVAHYYEFSTGETQRAIKVYELWHTLYPRDPVPIDNLAGEYMMAGQPQRSLELIPLAKQLESPNEVHSSLETQAYLRLGEYAKVRSICDSSGKQSMNSALHLACFEAEFAQNDESGMQRELQWARGNAVECLFLADSAWAAMGRGKSSQATAIFSQAEQSALKNNLTDLAANIGLDRAMLEAEVGLLPEGKRDARNVLKLPLETAAESAYAALALARAGDASLALSVARKAESMAPLDDVVNSGMLPAARAVVFLQQNDPVDALYDLEKSRPMDLYLTTQMVPDYYRGLAYLQNKRPQLALQEFRHVLDHRALLPTFSIYAVMCELQLGRAYQLLGDSSSADAAYKKVALAWKDADPGFPPLLELAQYRRLLPNAE